MKRRICPVDPDCGEIEGWEAFLQHVYETHTVGSETERRKTAERLLKRTAEGAAAPARTPSGEVYRGVDVPDALVPNEWELKHFKQGVDAALAVTVPLLEIFEDDPCGTYGEGRCVVHTYPGDVCPYGEVQDFLREAAGEEQVWRATVADPYLYWCLDHRPFIAVAPVRLKDMHPSVPVTCVQCGRVIRHV